MNVTKFFFLLSCQLQFIADFPDKNIFDLIFLGVSVAWLKLEINEIIINATIVLSMSYYHDLNFYASIDEVIWNDNVLV